VFGDGKAREKRSDGGLGPVTVGVGVFENYRTFGKRIQGRRRRFITSVEPALVSPHAVDADDKNRFRRTARHKAAERSEGRPRHKPPAGLHEISAGYGHHQSACRRV